MSTDGKFSQRQKYRPDIQMFKLQTNYRSKPHIVHAGNHIIKNNTNQYQKEIVAHRAGDEKLLFFLIEARQTKQPISLISSKK